MKELLEWTQKLNQCLQFSYKHFFLSEILFQCYVEKRMQETQYLQKKETVNPY
jgi:hypothetical protein